MDWLQPHYIAGILRNETGRRSQATTSYTDPPTRRGADRTRAPRPQRDGFTNQDLRAVTVRGLPPEAVTAGQMTYLLRRLRTYGLVTDIPRTRR